MSHKTLLISGASHSGKSTLARQIALKTGAMVTSTDQLAKHPGRPWVNAPRHVVQFYSALPGSAILTFLLQHYDNMWPVIEHRLMRDETSRNMHIFEGSALRPEYSANLAPDRYHWICLTAGPDILASRIRKNSGYEFLSPDMRKLTDVFIDRSLSDAALLQQAATDAEIDIFDTEQGDMTEDQILGLMERLNIIGK